MLEDLRFGVYRFLMRAKEPVVLPEFKGGVLRGAFGTVFKKMACSRSRGLDKIIVAPDFRPERGRLDRGNRIPAEAPTGLSEAYDSSNSPAAATHLASSQEGSSGQEGPLVSGTEFTEFNEDFSEDAEVEELQETGEKKLQEDSTEKEGRARERTSGREERPCRQCPVAVGCVYKAIFEPSPPPGSERLKNLEDIPRPFVFRIPPDPRRILNAGELLIWEMVLIGNAIGALPYFIVAFKEIGEIGFGLWHDGRRSKAHLEAVHSVNPFDQSAFRIYSGNTNTVDLSRHIEITGEDIMAEAKKLPRDFIMVEFKTPTRMRYQSRYVQVPEFHVLIRNLLRRLSTLSYFYQGKEVNVDFQGLISRASKVRINASDLTWKPWLRYSGRSKMRMDFGGFMGKVWYEGPLEEFLPLLVYGTLSNVGKTATFGLGQYTLGKSRTG
ncbi:MAG TPA: CRISPR system precrRNA processing endoribonuclease RAMP protein Cas6 [Firmicutes bacterium]|nr:CRISPR system precrRNA processing endoribonuclease RAMP protein Cas6 [Candidatus Fermentithermobacillaceae bacterium]